MAQLEGENLTIKSYQSTIHGLEIDRKNLQKQLKEMERAVRDITDVNKMAAVDSSAGACRDEMVSTSWYQPLVFFG